MTEAEVNATVKKYILDEFLPGEEPAALTDTIPLIGTGILDSIAVLKLVTFLEQQFSIRIEAYETGAENLNTVGDITRLVISKVTKK